MISHHDVFITRISTGTIPQLTWVLLLLQVQTYLGYSYLAGVRRDTGEGEDDAP